MSINRGRARLRHHTIASGSYSLPAQEDFTLKGSTMSWTPAMLRDREIGFIKSGTWSGAWFRLDNNYYQLQTVGSTTSSQNLSQTLAIGNNSGTYNIVMGTATVISSANGGGQIELDAFGLSNSIFISTDGVGSQASIEMYPNTTMVVSNNTAGISLISPFNIGIQSSNSSIISAPYFEYRGVAQNYMTIYPRTRVEELQISTASSTYDIATFSLQDGDVATIEVVGQARCGSPDRSYGCKMFAVFEKYSGTTYQVSTTDISAKDTFGDGTAMDIDTNGTIVRIRATNGGGLTTNFVVKYTYMSSQ